MGARFDVAFDQLRQGNFQKPSPEDMQRLVQEYDARKLMPSGRISDEL